MQSVNTQASPSCSSLSIDVDRTQSNIAAHRTDGESKGAHEQDYLVIGWSKV